MKRFITVVLTLPLIGFAQTGLDSELNQEIDNMYQQNGWQTAQQRVTTETIIEASNSASGDKVYLVQPSQPQQVQRQVIQQPVRVAPQPQQMQIRLQKQPTTVIQANPLEESRADKLRKQRQNLELETELRIVEKLEASRMQDEKRRASELFGDKFDSLQKKPEPVVAPPVVQPMVVETQDVDADQQAEIDIKEELQAAVAELKAEVQPVEKEKKSDRSYFGNVFAGVLEYPDAINIETRGALGLAFGMQQKRLLVDGTFVFANYEVEDFNGSPFGLSRLTDVDQFSLGTSVKYQILGGIIRPVVGVGLFYSYRSYTDTRFVVASEDATSNAIDVAAIAGVDLAFSDDFSIGLDFRYLTNITSWSDQDNRQQPFAANIANTTALEEIDYYIMSLTGRFNF